MHRRPVRVGLVLILIAVTIATGIQIAALEQQAAAARQRLGAFEAATWRLLVGTAELSGSVRSYVAEGQGERFWLDRAADEFAALTAELAGLRRLAQHQEAVGALDQAAAALETFRRADQRARDYVANGQRLMASDVIFSDALGAAAAAATQVSTARAREQAAGEGFLQAVRARQMAWLLGAAAVAVLIASLLAPRGRAQRDEKTPRASPADQASPTEPRPLVAASDLRAAADLCTDLGRVAETAELPPLLERAAHLLDASGLVVWLLDQTGTALRPLAAHGYTPQELERMGTVSREAENAVGIAFRSRKLQIVPSTERDEGALVAPLLTPTGCAGVLSAEVRRGTEGNEVVSALAVIVAAQIAALVGSAPQAETGTQPAARTGG